MNDDFVFDATKIDGVFKYLQTVIISIIYTESGTVD